MLISFENTKKQAASEPIEWFASLCVMTQGTNPGGHAFIAISSYDPAKNRISLNEHIGFYSKKWPIVGFAPFSEGVVIREKIEWLLKCKGIFQLSWAITETEKNTLQDALLKDLEYSKHPEGRKPYRSFNITSHACKTYSIEALSVILDLDLSERNNTLLDIPKLTGKMYLAQISGDLKNPISNDKPNEIDLFWSLPMVILPRGHEDPIALQRYSDWSRFSMLYFGVKEISKTLDRKIKLMSNSDSDKNSLDALNTSLQAHKNQMKKIKATPNQIDREKVDHYFSQLATLEAALQGTMTKIKQKSYLESIIDFLKILSNILNPMAWLDNIYPTLSAHGTLTQCHSRLKAIRI